MPIWSSLDPRIQSAIRRDAVRWESSYSWIVATALAAFYDIDIAKPYETPRRRRAA